MFRKNVLMLMSLLALTGFLTSAYGDTLDAAYLTGKWEINSDGACGKEDAEKLIVHDNATFEYGRRGKVEAVGFWRIEDDMVVFDMLTSPAFFQDIASELKALHPHAFIPCRLCRSTCSRTSSVRSPNDDQMSKLTLQRCR